MSFNNWKAKLFEMFQKHNRGYLLPDSDRLFQLYQANVSPEKIYFLYEPWGTVELTPAAQQELIKSLISSK